MSKEKNIMARVFQNPWFGGAVVFGFTSIISFFQINSYWADKNDFNGILGWLGIGIATGLITLFCGYKANKTSTGVGE